MIYKQATPLNFKEPEQLVFRYKLTLIKIKEEFV